MISKSKKIIGKNIYLRPLTIHDATEEYCSWLNDTEVNKYLETKGSTMSELREYVDSQINNPNSFFVGIFDVANDSHIGNIKLEPIDWDKRKAVCGIMIGKKNYRGRGIGTEATDLITKYSFDNLGLEVIELGVLTNNIGGVKAYTRAGFIETQRDIKRRTDGSMEEEILMIKRK